GLKGVGDPVDGAPSDERKAQQARQLRPVEEAGLQSLDGLAELAAERTRNGLGPADPLHLDAVGAEVLAARSTAPGGDRGPVIHARRGGPRGSGRSLDRLLAKLEVTLDLLHRLRPPPGLRAFRRDLVLAAEASVADQAD